ncbi:MAG: leucine-rich repeat protein [Clostridia bacterium]|nr:leucine-rich repeat protein [Clostridia bacterium]
MKKLLSVILALLMIVPMLSGMAAFADNGEVLYPMGYGYIYFNPSTGTITGGDENVVFLTIPETIDGVEVVAIDNNAFASHINVCELVIPATVESIGNYAFFGCPKLTHVTIEEGTKNVSIGNEAFRASEFLRSAVIPGNVKSIGDFAFGGCLRLNEVTLGEGIESLGNQVFGGCTDLETIVLPDSITELPYCLFPSCESLRSVTLPANIPAIPSWCFNYCENLTDLVIPESVESIGEQAFSSCKALNDIVIPANVKTLESSAFSGCESLESIILPDGLESIGNYCFQSCYALSMAYIPDTVTEIGEAIFSYCPDMDIYTAFTEEEWNALNVELNLAEGCVATFHFESTPPCEHSWGYWEMIEYPSCIKGGYESRTCSLCGETEVNEYGPSEDHNWGEWNIVTEPTETEEGLMERACLDCGTTESDSIPVISDPDDDHDNEPDLPADLPFADVLPDKWYTDAVVYCFNNGFMAGTGETEDGIVFDYKAKMDRQMFATILAKIDGADTSEYTEMSFADIKAGQWYSGAIEWAYRNGYASGVGTDDNGTPIFGRKDLVTRETLAQFLYTYSRMNGVDVSEGADLSVYTDLDRVHSWALEAVEWAVNVGMISGTSDTTLSPRNTATRAEVAIIIMNYNEDVK